MKGVATIAVLVLFVAAAIAQQSATAPYNLGDAYEVYSVVLPHEESYEFAKGTLVIQQETMPKAGIESCLTPEAANRFKDAIADYERVNRKAWILQRQFEIEKNYELVTAETIKVVFKEGSWDAFYKRYPGSGGYLTVSAVGFNENKTLAVVQAGSSCGGLCGRWGFHLLEKMDGKWRPVPGVTCVTMS